MRPGSLNRIGLRSYARSGLGLLLPLADLGAGEVNLTPAFAGGSGTPTYTRATTATTINSAGTIISVASGVPRSWYWPDTLVYGGYLAEPARTNLCLQSEDFSSASWTKTDTTVTANSIAAPDGATTADLLTAGAAGTDQVTQTITATADATYSVSWWGKAGNTQWVRALIFNGANFVRGWFDYQNGVVGVVNAGGTGVAVGGTATRYPNGWTRFTLTGSVGSGATAITIQTFCVTGDNSSTRVSNSTRYEWGAQFENNATYATSYIPTTTVSVTRNADVLTYPFAGNADATQGTAYAELGTFWTTAEATSYALLLSDASGRVLYTGAAGTSTVLSNFDGTTVANATVPNMATASRKVASAWGGSTKSIVGGGGTVASGAFDGSMGPGTGVIYIGNLSTNAWGGPIKNVAIWKKQRSILTLQDMTAG